MGLVRTVACQPFGQDSSVAVDGSGVTTLVSIAPIDVIVVVVLVAVVVAVVVSVMASHCCALSVVLASVVAVVDSCQLEPHLPKYSSLPAINIRPTIDGRRASDSNV